MLTGPWKHLKPLRIVLVKDDMDPLPNIFVPPTDTSTLLFSKTLYSTKLPLVGIKAEHLIPSRPQGDVSCNLWWKGFLVLWLSMNGSGIPRNSSEKKNKTFASFEILKVSRTFSLQSEGPKTCLLRSENFKKSKRNRRHQNIWKGSVAVNLANREQNLNNAE